jgi:hypothetical protein
MFKKLTLVSILFCALFTGIASAQGGGEIIALRLQCEDLEGGNNLQVPLNATTQEQAVFAFANLVINALNSRLYSSAIEVGELYIESGNSPASIYYFMGCLYDKVEQFSDANEMFEIFLATVTREDYALLVRIFLVQGEQFNLDIEAVIAVHRQHDKYRQHSKRRKHRCHNPT